MYEGMEIELNLVDVYRPDGPYTWVEIPTVDRPSCDGQDGLGVGRYRIRLGPRQEFTSCRSYPIAAMEPELVGVSFRDARSHPSYISAELRYCGGWWDFDAFRLDSLDDDAFGEVATPGQVPPLIVFRYMSGDCDCFDQWVGEVRVLDSSPSPGTDGG